MSLGRYWILVMVTIIIVITVYNCVKQIMEGLPTDPKCLKTQAFSAKSQALINVAHGRFNGGWEPNDEFYSAPWDHKNRDASTSGIR